MLKRMQRYISEKKVFSPSLSFDCVLVGDVIIQEQLVNWKCVRDISIMMMLVLSIVSTYAFILILYCVVDELTERVSIQCHPKGRSKTVRRKREKERARKKLIIFSLSRFAFIFFYSSFDCLMMFSIHFLAQSVIVFDLQLWPNISIFLFLFIRLLDRCSASSLFIRFLKTLVGVEGEEEEEEENRVDLCHWYSFFNYSISANKY